MGSASSYEPAIPALESGIVRSFNYPTIYQQGILALLDASPMPWTTEMLTSWFGCTEATVYDCGNWRRIWKCAPGVWTSMRHYESPVFVVSHDMVARWIPKPAPIFRQP